MVPTSTTTNRLSISSESQVPPDPTSNAGSTTSVPANTPTSTVQSGPGPALSQSWIAGSVVGSLLGVATIFVVIYCTKRKQRKEEWELGGAVPAKLFPKDEDEETTALPGKPQLHSECIPRKEMENTQVIPPLEPVGMELLTPRDDTNRPEKEWSLPISPLPALFAMTEMRDERTGGDDSPRHETFYHA
ncbi:hypothetical protein LSUB1_G002137 [Lachnellula subtilissima]|uniref:Uncharacterized protein n=1 Tax=Lachnellula subtilissima TaxID=602034 RepID=A0A8H8S040_9HELO|nr:hypothetical protein LSUB1_G002137 [Lachnellula subtilissima]